MADEIRRSGRATKGQHTKLEEGDNAQSTPAKPAKGAKTKNTKQGRGKKGKAAEPEPEEDEEEDEEDEEVIRCVCGITEETNKKRDYVACDTCAVWQHNDCMQLDLNVNWDEIDYYCEQCKPENHKELLAAMARGEQPWLKKAPKGKRKSLKGGAKARLSEVQSEQSEEVTTPKPVVEESVQQNATPQVSIGTNGTSKAVSEDAQPPSKRKRGSDVKDIVPPTEKRRKSEVLLSPADLPDERRKLTELMHKRTLTPIVRQFVKESRIRIPDNESESTYCEGKALEIDDALTTHLGTYEGKDSPYFAQYTTIQFNIKKNPRLLLQLLTGEVGMDELAKMSSDDMLSEENRTRDAKLREEAAKNAVMIHEEGPRIRKTHKGDEYIGDEDGNIQRARSPRPVPPKDQTAQDADALMGSMSHSVEMPPSNTVPQPLKIETSVVANSPKSARQPSDFNIQNVWSNVSSSETDAPRRTSELYRRQSSISVAQNQGATKDDDIDRLLQDNDQAFSPADFSNDPDIVFNGSIQMQPMATFRCVGRHVAGGDIGLRVPWSQLLRKNYDIRGRIDPQKANEYIAGIRNSDSTDVSVVSLTPVDDEGKEQKHRIVSYFLERSRWGVIAHGDPEPGDPRHILVRDVYIVPVHHDDLRLPAFIQMLEFCELDAPPKEDLLLLVIITRDGEDPHLALAEANQVPAPPSSVTPSIQTEQAISAPPPSAVTPHAPHFPASIAQPFVPPQSGFQPLSTARIFSILGPFVDTPVAKEVLKASPSEQVLWNLKSIMEKHPGAQDSMEVLTEAMTGQMKGA